MTAQEHNAEGNTQATCACGCGAPVTRKFRPGHDQRLIGRLAKAVAAGEMTEKAATDQIRSISPKLVDKAAKSMANRKAAA